MVMLPVIVKFSKTECNLFLIIRLESMYIFDIRSVPQINSLGSPRVSENKNLNLKRSPRESRISK